MAFFSGTSYPADIGKLQAILRDWLIGKQGNWPAGSGAQNIESALSQMFNSASNAVNQGTPFYQSLIPSSPGALSPAVSVQKNQAMDALNTSLQGAGVSQLGQLNREYGGRLPASMVQSGFGNLARAGASGATDIARNAVMNNINLGEQGVQGLAGLSQLAGSPVGSLTGATSASTAGAHYNPGVVGNTEQILGLVGQAAGAIGGFAGLGGGGSGTGAGFGIGSGGTGLGPGSLPLGGTNLGFGGLGGVPSLQPPPLSPTQQYLNIGR